MQPVMIKSMDLLLASEYLRSALFKLDTEHCREAAEDLRQAQGYMGKIWDTILNAAQQAGEHQEHTTNK